MYNLPTIVVTTIHYITTTTSLQKEAFTNPDESLRDELKLPLHDHQLKSYTFYRQINYCADLSEPGAEKTGVQLALIRHRMYHENCKRILIVCPLSIVDYVWRREILKFIGKHISHNIFMLSDSVKYARDILEANLNGIYIINYDKVRLIEDHLKLMKFDFIILDESDNIKNPTSQRSKAILSLGALECVRFKSVMTGTPSGSMLDLFTQYSFLDETLLGDNFVAYRNRFFYKDNENQFLWLLQPGAKAKIKQLTDLYSVAWKKKDVKELPPLTSVSIEGIFPAKQATAYKKMSEDLIVLLDDDYYNAEIKITQILRLAQITSGFITSTEHETVHFFKPNPKLDLLAERIREIPLKKKIIIWAVFHQSHDLIYDFITTKLKQKVVQYHGRISKKKRRLALESFIEGDARFIIAHPKSLGAGINLSVASYSIRFDYTHSFKDYYQSIERFNREGQKYPMTEYVLVIKNSIDSIILQSVQKKKNINDFVTDIKGFLK